MISPTLRPGQVISPPLAGPAAQYRYILSAARIRGCTEPLPLAEQASQVRALQYLQTLCPPGYQVRQRSWDGSWVVDPIPSEEK